MQSYSSSQSLKDQGKSRTYRTHKSIVWNSGSQSLKDQGKSRTQGSRGRRLSCLRRNPLKIRASLGPVDGMTGNTAHTSQSLKDQGKSRTSV